jgi:acyl carrier protein
MDAVDQAGYTARVRELIVQDMGWGGRPEDLVDSFPLIDNDVIDSMGIYQIVSFLEDEYGIVVADEDLVPENFETLEAIGRFAHANASQ